MIGDEEIRIEGLREFRRSLREIDRDTAKRLRVGFNSAAQIVATEAKRRVPLGPPRAGHVRSTIKAGSTQSAARVQGGGARYPYFGFLDFGGRVGPRNSVRRPFIRKGRYLWPSYLDKADVVRDELGAQIARLARSAGLEVD